MPPDNLLPDEIIPLGIYCRLTQDLDDRRLDLLVDGTRWSEFWSETLLDDGQIVWWGKLPSGCHSQFTSREGSKGHRLVKGA